MNKILISSLAMLLLVSCGSKVDSSKVSSTSSLTSTSSSLVSEVSSEKVSSTISSSSEQFNNDDLYAWSESQLDTFERYLRTRNVPHIGVLGAEIYLDAYQTSGTIYIQADRGSEKKLNEYLVKLEAAGYTFRGYHDVDESSLYELEIDDKTVLVANPYISKSEKFVVNLHLENKKDDSGFEETGAWKENELAIFSSYLLTENIPYGGYGAYSIDLSSYEALATVKIVYSNCGDMSSDYTSKVEEIGGEEFFGYVTYNVNREYFLDYSFAVNGSNFEVKIAIVGNILYASSWPESAVNEYVNFTIPTLNSASGYEYFYDLSYGGSITVTAYGDQDSLVSEYISILESNNWIIDYSYAGNNGMYFANDKTHTVLLTFYLYEDYFNGDGVNFNFSRVK